MKLPSLQFYPGDWRKDPGVQSLSYHDRGVWFEILCLMHESPQRGKLLLNGKSMPDAALCRLLGLDMETLLATLGNLLEFGVASRDDETGALISRRMIRDEEVRNSRAAGGQLGKDAGRQGAEHGSKGGRPRKEGRGCTPPVTDSVGDPASKAALDPSSEPRFDPAGKPPSKVSENPPFNPPLGTFAKAPLEPPPSSSSSSSSSEGTPIPPFDETGQKPLCTLDAAKAFAASGQVRISAKAVEHWWHNRNASGWRRGGVGNALIRSWQSDMAASVTWAEDGAGKAANGGEKPRPAARL